MDTAVGRDDGPTGADTRGGEDVGVDDPGPWPSALYRDVVEELTRLHRRKPGHPDSVLESSAFAILMILTRGPSRTLRELAEELDLEQSTVNRQVNAAIKHGHLERFEVPGSPSRLIRPSESGRAAYRHDSELRIGQLKRAFADLAPGTPEGLLREVRAFNEAFDRVENADSHRHTDRGHRPG